MTIKISLGYFEKMEKESKICLKLQRPQIAKEILIKNKSIGIKHPDLKLYHKTIVVKTI